MTLKIGILVSGRGTNLEAIIESYKNNELGEVEISVVISNKLNTAAIEKAKEHNIDTLIIEQKKNNNSKYDEILYKSLVNKGVTKENGLVVLAGFMKILSPWFIEQFKNRIINIHPSILPSFTGLESQKQAIEYGVKVSGCTVHFVTADVDSGPIILQESVKIKEGDRERIQAFQGNVIKGRFNKLSPPSVESTFTVRRISSGIGVERIFPYFSSIIDSLKVTRKGKVRQGKLYYLRGRTGKSARIKERR